MHWKDKFIHQYRIILASKDPWQMTLREFMDSLLFHGTLEPIDGDIRGGGYDNIFWTAHNPAVAQNYIPITGGTFIVPRIWNLDEPVRPAEDYTVQGMAAKQMGLGWDRVEYDQYQRPNSWAYKDNKRITWAMIKEFLENEMGYKPNDNGGYRIRHYEIDGVDQIVPASFKAVGQLYMLMNKGELKIYDYTGHGGDLMDPQYNHIKIFKMLEQEGYDGVKINDYAQSENWGNVGHESIGIFPSGLRKIKYLTIPASNFDWDVDNEKLQRTKTEEFEQYHKQQVKEALDQGKPVPPEVLREYGDLVNE